jgi:hypothetical protein
MTAHAGSRTDFLSKPGLAAGGCRMTAAHRRTEAPEHAP